MELLTRESVDRDRDGRWLAQTLRADFSGFGAGEVVLLLAGFGEDGLVLAWRG
jgi:hypothetical protein